MYKYIQNAHIPYDLPTFQHFPTHVNYDFLTLKSQLPFTLEVRELFWELLGHSAPSGSLSSDPGRTACCSSPSGLLF